MEVPPNRNGCEFHGIVLRPHFRGGQQETENLRIGVRSPASENVQKEENQHAAKEAIEKVERRGPETHGEEKQLSLGPEDGEGP
jgi:hypothetical protein